MHRNIYLDESGDLGWTFNKIYRQGGSSRYLTIAYLITDINHINVPRRFVRDFYTHFKFNPSKEIKASELKSVHKEYIAIEAAKMLSKHNNFIIGSITVRKENVPNHIRNSGDELYGYMIGNSAISHINDELTCKITRDYKTAKVSKGLITYLQTLVWFHDKKSATLNDSPKQSHQDDGIIFIDWISNIVWSKYEDNYTKWVDNLNGVLREDTLFF